MKTHRMKSMAMAAFVVAVMVVSAAAQEAPRVPEAALKSAQQAFQLALGTTQKTQTFDAMGLRSEAESRQAVLGAPIALQEIGYDKLVAYQPGNPPQSVFAGPDQVLFPVMVGKSARSLITMARSGEGWRMTSYGDPDRAAAIEAVKAALQKEKAASSSQAPSFSVVSVPSFQFDLVAATLGPKTYLSALSPAVAAEFGLPATAEFAEVVSKLSAYAKAFDAKYGDQIRQKRLAK
jgi:alkanesulfonate monooxygenase SsuD/methylene tetrahydromethanopterin reductase-like flavin-dependent oxidoreductase (luciferase family)